MKNKNRGIPDDIYKRRRLLPRKSNPAKHESHVPIECPICGFERLLKLHDARLAIAQERPCKQCDSSIKGKVGAAVLMKRYTKVQLLEFIQKSQLAKPSSSEVEMADLLDEALPQGFTYEKQEIFYEGYIIDFVIYNGESVVLLLEVNGYWHRRQSADRDRALQLTSLIPVEFVDAELCHSPEGQLEIIRTLNPYIKKEIEQWERASIHST